MENWKNNRLIYFALFFIILSCIVLRFVGLNLNSLWQDELTLYFHSQKSPERILYYSRYFSFHPPLFYFIYKPWITLVDFSEVGLRSFHVFLGIMTGLLPLFFQKWIGNNKAIIYAVLLLGNLTLIKWSQEALVYSTSLFLLVFFFLSFARSRQLKTWKSYIPTIILLILINYLNYLLLVVANLYALAMTLIEYKKSEIIKKNLLMLASSFAFYIPWMLTNHLFRNLLGFKSNTAVITFWNKPKEIQYDIWNNILFIFNQDIFFIIIFSLIFFISIRKRMHRETLINYVPMIFVIICYFMFIWINSLDSYSLFVNKYFLFLVPCMLYMLSYAIARFRKETQILMVSVYLIMNFIPFRSYGTLRGYHDYRSPFIELSKENITAKKNLYLFVFNPDWLTPYVYRYGLNKNFHILGKRGDCQNKETIMQTIDKLHPGDVIYLPKVDCADEFLIVYLRKKNRTYKRYDFEKVQLLSLTN